MTASTTELGLGRGSANRHRQDPGKLFDVNVNQLAGPVPLIAVDGFTIGGAITGIEPGHSLGTQDVLHRRRGQADLERDVIGTPAALLAQPDDLGTSPW